MKSDIQLPRHVALIMDGNRRWARERRYPDFIGHKKGEERIEPIIDYAIERGISYLTFWAFSTENWKRGKDEVQFLLNLYRRNLDKKINSFHKKNVKVKVIGNVSLFPEDIINKTKQWEEKTAQNSRITVNFALSYGGRDEILRAIEKWRASSLRQNSGQAKLTEEEFEKYLDTAGQPDPDLLIRTGGEMRLSGFLLWQIEYCELYFSNKYWPDFTSGEFQKALDEFTIRRRRYGK